jgi:hypothetical protein
MLDHCLRNDYERTMFSRLTGRLLAFMAFVLAPTAQAAPLPAGAVLLPVPDEGMTTGQVVRRLVSPFDIPGGVEGKLTTTALAGDVTNPLGGLTLTNLLEVTGGPGGESIGRLTTGTFVGTATDVSVVTQQGQTSPAFVDRNPSGDIIGISFYPSPQDPQADFLSPGRSAMLVVQTNAPGAGPGIAYLLGNQGVSVRTLAINYAPEPATWQLAAVAAGATMALRCIRQRRFSAVSVQP